MMKTHCDNCDAATADDRLTKVVDIGFSNSIQHRFKLVLYIQKEYSEDGQQVRQDLCASCKRRAVTKLLEAIGGELR
jgi:hypothetical protein